MDAETVQAPIVRLHSCSVLRHETNDEVLYNYATVQAQDYLPQCQCQARSRANAALEGRTRQNLLI